MRRIEWIEKRYGKPIAQVLIDLHAKLGTSAAVAEELEVHPMTISKWTKKLNLQVATVLRPKEEACRESA